MSAATNTLECKCIEPGLRAALVLLVGARPGDPLEYVWSHKDWGRAVAARHSFAGVTALRVFGIERGVVTSVEFAKLRSVEWVKGGFLTWARLLCTPAAGPPQSICVSHDDAAAFLAAACTAKIQYAPPAPELCAQARSDPEERDRVSAELGEHGRATHGDHFHKSAGAYWKCSARIHQRAHAKAAPASAPARAKAAPAGARAAKPGRQPIPAAVRAAVWAAEFPQSLEARCVCCKTQPITATNFECGHVVAHARGGPTTVANLRPICGLCNKSMGTANMDEFVEKYALG